MCLPCLQPSGSLMGDMATMFGSAILDRVSPVAPAQVRARSPL